MPDAAVHLVDASPYVFRAYFSLPSSMVDGSGRPVGAVYGFGAFLLRLLAEESPSHLGVAFDGSLTTSFRNEIYPGYKAGRDLPPPELEAQLEDCREMARALGGAAFVDDTFEADDLLGTLCRRLRTTRREMVVVSSDKDLAQLVGERVALYDFARGERYGPREVEAKHGVRPGQIADLLALAGDPVDSIPGVRGVGKKTAVALLAEFGDLDGIYDRLHEIERLPVRGARSIARKLEAGRDDAYLSRRLARISTEAPIEARIDDLAWRGADRSLVEPLFERLGFRTLAERVPRWR